MKLHHDDNRKANLLISTQPNIGLEGDVRRAVVEILNHTLANEVVLAEKSRKLSWNISITDLSRIQYLFNSHYEQLNLIADEIGERIRILGGTVIGSLQEFLDYASLKDRPGEIPEIMELLADHEALIRSLREDSRKCSEEYEDEGTVDLLVGLMRLHEKMAWMLRSYIEPDQPHDEKQSAKH